MARCLVIGASGYVGAHLVEALAGAGHRVRALARSLDPAALPAGVEGVRADVHEGIDAAMADVEVAYHLVHSMDGDGYAEVDAGIARHVAAAAAAAAARQLVYLGGPEPRDRPLSTHLASRAEVGRVFLDAPTPALVLRAAMVVGRGSASLTLLGQAARSGPVVLRPSWMDNRSRPVALADVLHHLLRAAEPGEPVNAAFDVAGPESVTYLELVQRYARVAGLPRRLPVPVFGLSAASASAAAAALGPLPASLVRALLDSLQHDLLPDPRDVLPPPPGGGTSLDRALRAALGEEVPTPPPPGTPGLLVDSRTAGTRADAPALWRAITGIGGRGGWHTLPGAWTLRGALDHLLGGVGLHRGRPAALAVGDTVDAWSVAARDDDRAELVLKADMKLPGTAWLTMSATPAREGATYTQTITFAPDGRAGRLYWFLQRPAHELVFATMAHGLTRAAERLTRP